MHGAAQNRRGDVSTAGNTLGAPSSSPHRVLRPTEFFAHQTLPGSWILAPDSSDEQALVR